MQGRAAPIGQHATGAAPFSLPRPPPASPPSSAPPLRPQPPYLLLGWAGPGRARRGWSVGLSRAQRGSEGPSSAPAEKRQGALRNTMGTPHVLTFKGIRPPSPELLVPVAAERRKLLICNQNRLCYWACPVSPLKTCRSLSVSISIIWFLQTTVTGGFYRRFYL